MKYCFKCGKELPEEANFCNYCGAKQTFAEQKKDKVEESSSDNLETKICTNCGKKIEAEIAFCPYCGTEQNFEDKINNLVKDEIPTTSSNDKVEEAEVKVEGKGEDVVQEDVVQEEPTIDDEVSLGEDLSDDDVQHSVDSSLVGSKLSAQDVYILLECNTETKKNLEKFKGNIQVYRVLGVAPFSNLSEKQKETFFKNCQKWTEEANEEWGQKDGAKITALDSALGSLQGLVRQEDRFEKEFKQPLWNHQIELLDAIVRSAANDKKVSLEELLGIIKQADEDLGIYGSKENQKLTIDEIKAETLRNNAVMQTLEEEFTEFVSSLGETKRINNDKNKNTIIKRYAELKDIECEIYGNKHNKSHDENETIDILKKNNLELIDGRDFLENNLSVFAEKKNIVLSKALKADEWYEIKLWASDYIDQKNVEAFLYGKGITKEKNQNSNSKTFEKILVGDFLSNSEREGLEDSIVTALSHNPGKDNDELAVKYLTDEIDIANKDNKLCNKDFVEKLFNYFFRKDIDYGYYGSTIHPLLQKADMAKILPENFLNKENDFFIENKFERLAELNSKERKELFAKAKTLGIKKEYTDYLENSVNRAKKSIEEENSCAKASNLARYGLLILLPPLAMLLSAQILKQIIGPYNVWSRDGAIQIGIYLILWFIILGIYRAVSKSKAALISYDEVEENKCVDYVVYGIQSGYMTEYNRKRKYNGVGGFIFFLELCVIVALIANSNVDLIIADIDYNYYTSASILFLELSAILILTRSLRKGKNKIGGIRVLYFLLCIFAIILAYYQGY